MSLRRRVLLVTQYLGPGGAERQIAHLARGLASAGHDVTLLVLGHAYTEAASAAAGETGAKVVQLHAESPKARAQALWRVTRMARHAEVVVCNEWDATLWGRVAAIAARRRAIVIEHAVYRGLQTSQSGKPRGRWIAAHNRLLNPFTYATVACARAQIPVLLSEGVSPKKLALIPNGVQVAELRASATTGPTREDLGISKDSRVIIHVGRLTDLKNHDQTVATGDALRAAGLDIHVLVLGTGERREWIDGEAATRPWLHVLGAQDSVAPYLAMADLAVLPSRAEAMPMALIEGFALSVPIVAFDVGDVGALVNESGAGVVIEPGDSDGFTAACRELLEGDGKRLQQMAAAARAASEGFDASRMSSNYETLIEAAVTKQPPSSAKLAPNGI